MISQPKTDRTDLSRYRPFMPRLVTSTPDLLETPESILEYGRRWVLPLARKGAMPDANTLAQSGHEEFLSALFRNYPGGLSGIARDLGLIHNERWHIRNYVALLERGHMLLINPAGAKVHFVVVRKSSPEGTPCLALCDLSGRRRTPLRFSADNQGFFRMLQDIEADAPRIIDLLNDIEIRPPRIKRAITGRTSK